MGVRDVIKRWAMHRADPRNHEAALLVFSEEPTLCLTELRHRVFALQGEQYLWAWGELFLRAEGDAGRTYVVEHSGFWSSVESFREDLAESMGRRLDHARREFSIREQTEFALQIAVRKTIAEEVARR